MKGTRRTVLTDKQIQSEQEIVSAIKFAESEGDWDEVERLYKLLFDLHDQNMDNAA